MSRVSGTVCRPLAIHSAGQGGARRAPLGPRVAGGSRISPAGSQRQGLPTETRLTRSEEHTSELQSLMRISYAVFCLKKKKMTTRQKVHKDIHTGRESEKNYKLYTPNTLKHN